jgi:hypothetical protein
MWSLPTATFGYGMALPGLMLVRLLDHKACLAKQDPQVPQEPKAMQDLLDQ